MKPFFASKTHTGHHIRIGYGADDSIPEGTQFMIQSPSPACAAEAATARRRPDWII